MPEPLSSPEAYQAFIYSLTERFPVIRRSTLIYIPSGELSFTRPNFPFLLSEIEQLLHG
jgi:hypothetical protein